MIHAHIKRTAVSINEESFQVQLPDAYSHANETFEDGDGLDPDWLKIVWQRMFQIKMAAAHVVIPPGAKVLDACCGQGFLGECLAIAGASVTFCDISPLQLDALKARYAAQKLTVKVAAANLLCLPFKNDEFDYVVGNSFLHHLPDVPKGLSELARVLKPGGRLLLFHEPGIRANYWETFPVSLLRDTTYNSGFTDLWQFESDRLAGVIMRSGFGKPKLVGSGLLSAVLLNAYFILLGKLKVNNRWALEPVLRLRALCYRFEAPLRSILDADAFPSLFITATRLIPSDMK